MRLRQRSDCAGHALSLANTFLASAIFLSEASAERPQLLLLLREGCKVYLGRVLESAKVGLGLLVVLQHRVLILADLLHGRDLAEESIGVGVTMS